MRNNNFYKSGTKIRREEKALLLNKHRIAPYVTTTR